MSRRCARRCSHIALIGLVMVCCACTKLSKDEKDTAIRPERPTPAWTSPSPCVPEEAELTMKSDQFRAALECAVKDFRWPPGMFPDIDWIMDAEEGSTYEWNYQIGLEHTQLGGINQCAWYVTWLEARKAGDLEIQDEALAYMTDVIPNFAEVIPGFPPDGRSGGTVQRDREVAAAAALGDPSGVQYFVKVTCASIPFVPQPSATPAPTE